MQSCFFCNCKIWMTDWLNIISWFTLFSLRFLKILLHCYPVLYVAFEKYDNLFFLSLYFIHQSLSTLLGSLSIFTLCLRVHHSRLIFSGTCCTLSMYDFYFILGSSQSLVFLYYALLFNSLLLFWYFSSRISIIWLFAFLPPCFPLKSLY